MAGAPREANVDGMSPRAAQQIERSLVRRTEVKVDSENPEHGSLLIISGEKDHTVPRATANASYKKQQRNPGITEITEMPNRSHALTIDNGWQEVADTALASVRRQV
jgi:hypothetical protein